MQVSPGSYLSFNKGKAVARGRRSGRSRAFRWFRLGFGFSWRGGGFPVERVLLADSLQQEDVEVKMQKPGKCLVQSCYLVI